MWSDFFLMKIHGAGWGGDSRAVSAVAVRDDFYKKNIGINAYICPNDFLIKLILSD